MATEILVTGARGQVGTELSMMDRGGAMGRKGDTDFAVAPAADSLPSVSAYDSAMLDITAMDRVAEVIGKHAPGVVINCAAFTAVDAAEDQRELAYQVNETGAGNIARVCADLDIPLIHISTDYVFGTELGSTDGAHTPIQTSAVPDPINVYGASKLAGESAVAAAGGHHSIVRAGWIFGRLDRGFVHTMLTLATSRDVIRVVADQHGTPCFAGHLAATLLLLAERTVDDPAVGGIHHYSGAPPTTWYGFACNIVDSAKRAGIVDPNSVRVEPITSAEFPTRARRPCYSVLDGRELNELLGQTAADWHTGITTCMQLRSDTVA